MNSLRGRIAIALALVAFVLPLFFHRQYFSGDAIIYGADTAQLQLPRYEILCDTLQGEFRLPLWQNLLYGGSPFHANPENPTLYPPILALATFLPPLLTINLTILLHLGLCAVGMFVLVQRLWSRMGRPETAPAGAFVAAVIFSLSLWTRQDHLNLVAYGAAHAFIPWILWASDRLLFSDRPRQSVGLLALLLAGQIFTGGLYVIPYSFLLLGLWFTLVGLLGNPETRTRAIRGGLLAGLIALVIASAKLLPYLEWLPTTNRGDGLGLIEARGVTLGGHGEFTWELARRRVLWFTGGGWGLAPALLALPLLRHATVRAVFLLAGFFFAVSLGGPLYRVLFEVVPPFDQIRDARRAWLCVNALVPIASGLGTCWLLSILGLWRWPAVASLLGLGLGLVIAPRMEHTSYRLEEALHQPDSFEHLMGLYPVWTEAAEKAGHDWRAFYLHKDVPDGRNEQFITSALGVETPAGYLGHVWPRRLARHLYSPDGTEMPSRLRHPRLGMMSVRYFVTQDASVAPQVDPLLLFPKGIDGTAVFENSLARPRAIMPSVVCALFGDQDDELLYALLDHPLFPSQSASVLSIESGERLSDAELEALDAVVLVEVGAAEDDEVRVNVRAARKSGALVTTLTLPLDDAGHAAIEELAQRIHRRSLTRPPVNLAFERKQSGTSLVSRLATETGSPKRFVVVSEPWSMYPGWKATASGATVPIRRADGVCSAVLLEPRMQALTARYSPLSVLIGYVLGALGLLWAGRILWRG
jgi:hypothetical protein